MSAHRSTHLLHSALLIASSSALSHDISRPLKSFLMISVQFFCGLSLLFLPSGTQSNVWLALLWPRATCGLATSAFLPYDLLHILLSRPLPYMFVCNFIAP